MNRIALSIVLPLLAVFAPGVSGQDKKVLSADEAKFQLDVYRAEARKPLSALRNCSRSSRITRELDPEKSPYTSLENLRTIYRQESDKVRAEIAANDIRLLNDFIAHLEKIVQDHTRKGQLEEALDVRSRIESTQKEIEELKSGSIPLPVSENGGKEEIILGSRSSFEKNSKIEVKKDGNLFILTGTGNNTRVESRRI
jgi:hypothetical protein